MSTTIAPAPVDGAHGADAALTPPPNGGMTTVTMRGLRANSSRFALTALAVVLSVAFFTSILLLTDALRGSASDDIAAANTALDAVVRGEELASGDAGPRDVSLATNVPEATLPAVAAADGVSDAVGVSSGYARVLDDNGQPVDIGSFEYVGETWIADEELNPYVLDEGRPPTETDEVVVERSVADELGLSAGDPVRVATTTGTIDATVSGIATYGPADGSPTASSVLFAPDHAAAVLGTAGFDRIVVELTDGPAGAGASETAVASLADAVRSIAGDDSGVEVVSGAAFTTELQTEVDDRTGFQTTFLLFFAVVALVAGSTIIYNTFVIAIQQRTRELALLRSIGASRRQVLTSVMAEAGVIAVVSSAIGAVAGIAGFYGLIALFEAIGLSFLGSGVEIAAPSLVIPIALGLLVTLASAFLPARRAAAIPPVAALRDSSVDTSGESRLRTRAGVGILAVAALASVVGFVDGAGVVATTGLGLAFVGVIVAGPAITRLTAARLGRGLELGGRITGRLARTNAARNPKRSASTAFSLTLGVALISLFTVVASSLSSGISTDVEDGLRSDRVVAALGDTPADALSVPLGLSAELAAVDGVSTVSPVATTSGVVDDELAFIGGVDLATIEAVYDLDVLAGSLDLLDASTVAVDADTDLAVGDTVTVAGIGGRGEFTVGAVFDRTLPGSPVGPAYVFDRATFDAIAPGTADSFVLVTTDGIDAAATDDALRTIVDDAGAVSLYTGEEYVESLGSFLDTFQNFVYALLGVAVIIALVGIANTTVMSVNERTREIGMLRAVGTTSRQVRSMIRNEALMLSVQGAIVGLLLGVVGASAVFELLSGDQGFALVIPWLDLGRIAVLSVIAGVVAAAWPAWRASRRPALEAMADD